MCERVCVNVCVFVFSKGDEMGACLISPLKWSKTSMEKPRAEDTAVEDRSILIKSGSAQNVCTSCFCRHEKILQSVSFPP